MSDIDLPGIKRIVTRGSCGACFYCVREQDDLTCHYNPPQHTYLIVPEPTALQGVQPVLRAFAGFPVVRNDQWCGHFKKMDSQLSDASVTPIPGMVS